VWTSQAAGAVADQILPVALSLYVVSQGGGVGAVSAVLGGRAVALVVCLLVGGILADRVSRPRLLVTTDVVRAGTVVVTVATLSVLPLAALALVTAVCGGAEALARPAQRSLVPVLLPGRLLERGNALVSGAQRGATVAGVLGGSVLVTTLGAPTALIVAGLLFAGGAVAVLGLREPGPRTATGTGVLRDAAQGVEAITSRPWVGTMMVVVAVQLLTATAPALVLLPVIATRDLGGGIAYGAVLAALAAGALPAVVLAGRRDGAGPGSLTVGLLSLYALLPLSLALPLPLVAVALCFAVGGFVVEYYFVQWLSALQRSVPAHLLGKVMAVDQLGAFALLPVGYAAVGPVVGLLGERSALVLGAVIAAGVPVLALLVPGVRRMADQP
jgi:hypothetical protein